MPKEYSTTVAWIREDTPTVYTIAINISKEIPAPKPGQFFMIISVVNGIEVKKPYSYSSWNNNVVEFCVKMVPGGRFSNHLHTLKKGNQIKLSGPFGVFTLRQPTDKEIIFLATGSGISALKPMIYQALSFQSPNVWLFLGVKVEQEIIYRKEFEALASQYNKFKFIPVLSRQSWSGETGHVQDVVSKYISSREADIYICGVPQMVEDCKNKMESLGFPKGRIFFEKYT